MMLIWIGMWFPTLIGIFVLVMLFRPEKEDGVTDSSNRINRIQLLWLALTRRKLFISLFPWLAHDVYDNLKDKP